MQTKDKDVYSTPLKANLRLILSIGIKYI